MPASGPEGTGVKLVTIARDNPARGLPLIQGCYALFSPGVLSPELLIDAAALTSLRTASVSALATRHLARADSRELVVFGAGAQAEAHVGAMLAVRPIERVTIVASSPSSPRARDLAERLSGDVERRSGQAERRSGDVERAPGLVKRPSGGVEIRIGTPDAVATADIVCTCTTSATPVFDGELLAPGAHVNAVGAYRPDLREIDLAVVSRALVVVETLEAAAAEAGDLLAAIDAGVLPPKGFAHELSDVVAGRAGRASDSDVTLFKSVGLAVEDLVLARAAADRLSGAADARDARPGVADA